MPSYQILGVFLILMAFLLLSDPASYNPNLIFTGCKQTTAAAHVNLFRLVNINIQKHNVQSLKCSSLHTTFLHLLCGLKVLKAANQCRCILGVFILIVLYNYSCASIRSLTLVCPHIFSQSQTLIF